MAIFAAFTKISEAIEINGSASADTGATRRAPYVTESIELNDQQFVRFNIDDIPVSDTGGEFWATWYVKPEAFGNNGEVRFYDTDFDPDNPVITVFGTNGMENAGVRIWDGASQAVIIADPDNGIDELIKWDLQFIRDDTVGVARLYRNGVLHGEVTGIDTNRAAWTNINQVQPINNGNTTGGDICYFSAFILADEDTRDLVFVEETFTGVGAVDNLSTGGFTEVTDGNTATFGTMLSVGLGLTALGDLTNDIDTGFTVETVVTSLVVNKTGVAVDEITALTRIGGTNYTAVEKPITANNPATELIQFLATTSPATSLAWTVAELEGSEGGFQSS